MHHLAVRGGQKRKEPIGLGCSDIFMGLVGCKGIPPDGGLV